MLVVPSGTTVKPRNEANEVILESIKYFVFLKGGSFKPSTHVEASLERMPAVVAWVLPSKFYFLPGSLTDWLPLVSATTQDFSQQVEKFNK